MPDFIQITEGRNISRRHSAEPWYSRAVNYGIGSDPEEVKIRKEMLSDYVTALHLPKKRHNEKEKCSIMTETGASSLLTFQTLGNTVLSFLTLKRFPRL
jgi:hypothetical protein